MVGVIYRKEFLGFLKSPLFYLVTFLATILLGITFSLGLHNFALSQANAMFQFAQSQEANIHYAVFLQHLSLLNMVFMFFIPALAMRLLAEEKRQRTFDLLLTSPVTSAQIVLGKYLALFSIAIVIVGVAALYFLLSRRMFEFSWAPTIVATLGIILVAGVYVAVSLFASSLTDNSLVALALGIVFNISLWILGGLTELFETSAFKAYFEQLSMNQHLQSMIDGVIKSSGLVFFVSMIFLFCFLTERVIESARWRA